MQNNMEEFIAFRRYLHQHPDPSHHQQNTTHLIRNKLIALGVEENSIKDVGGKGLWADLRGTAQPSGKPRCILLRADIDALTMNQQNPQLQYRSINHGVAHMCGHDGHIASLCAFIHLFLKQVASVPSDNVVRCLFQPAEQTLEGAKVMIEKGCLEGVDEVYGYHNVNKAAFGKVAIVKGPFMAGSCTLKLRIQGTGGHASQPQNTKYALPRVIQLHQKIISFADELRQQSKQVFTVIFPLLHAGERFNVISETVRLEGTIRAFSEDIMDKVIEKIEIELNTMREDGFECWFEHRRGKVTCNHDEPVEHVMRVTREYLGEDSITDALLPSRAGEDFAEYLLLRPGAFFFVLGQDQQHDSMLHVANYDFNDRLLLIVANLWIRLVKDRFGAI